MTIAGYIVTRATQKRASDNYCQMMAYGDDNDPAPHMLLTFRGATLFASFKEATTALADTLREADTLGCKWQSEYSYGICEVRYAPARDINNLEEELHL